MVALNKKRESENVLYSLDGTRVHRYVTDHPVSDIHWVLVDATVEECGDALRNVAEYAKQEGSEFVTFRTDDGRVWLHHIYAPAEQPPKCLGAKLSIFN